MKNLIETTVACPCGHKMPVAFLKPGPIGALIFRKQCTICQADWNVKIKASKTDKNQFQTWLKKFG